MRTLAPGHDAAYLAVAEILGCELWTADERLYNSVKTDMPRVRWLGDFATTDRADRPPDV